VLSLLLAALFFTGIHLGIAGTAMRNRAIGILGKNGYTAAFAVASIIGFGWLVAAYNRAGIATRCGVQRSASSWFSVVVPSQTCGQPSLQSVGSMSPMFCGRFVSKNQTSQMQAMQMAQFTLLPSILLSGFMFPFYGMPIWAQWAGEIFPTTHELRIVRGMLLKGNGAPEILPELWPIAAFTLLAAAAAIWSYRETLD
jgi:hypothetical protein